MGLGLSLGTAMGRTGIISVPVVISNWTSLGTDAVIAASVSVNAKVIRRMTFWDDKLFLGYGDVNAASAPRYIRYWDPGDGTFKTLASRVGGEESDALAWQTIWNDRLWLPYQDPSGVGQYVVVSLDGTAAVQTGLVPGTVHADAMEAHGDALYLAGSGLEPFYGASVWRSADGGATWTQVFAPNIPNALWITAIFSYGGYLWVQPIDPLNLGAKVGNTFKSADGLTWTDAGYSVTPNTHVPRRIVTFAGKAFIKTGPGSEESNSVGFFLAFDGTGVATDITASVGSFNTQDVCVADGALYVLSGGTRIWRSTDGVTFTRIGTTPASCESIEVVGTDVYVASGATVYRGTRSVAAEDSATYLTDGGGAYLINADGEFIKRG